MVKSIDLSTLKLGMYIEKLYPPHSPQTIFKYTKGNIINEKDIHALKILGIEKIDINILKGVCIETALPRCEGLPPDGNNQFSLSVHTNHKKKLYGHYGFKDSFNLNKNWFAQEYLAIDQGITVLMIENFRSKLIWKYFMELDPIKKWIQLCNLHEKQA